jgi:hypothetical protein
MRQSLIRIALVGALATALVVLGAGAVSAAQGQRPAPRPVFPGFRAAGLGGGPGGIGFAFGGPGLGLPFPAVRGLGPGLAFAGPGDAATLYADVLTPAAAFLNVSVSTLASDLAGGKTLAREATDKGKTAEDLITAVVNAQKTVFDNEKAAGWITANQETALVTSFTNAVTDLVNNGPAVPAAGPVPAIGGSGGPLQLAAAYLGISATDLLKDLQGGKSLADVVASLGSSGKTVAGLVAALEAPAKTRLDAAVSAGTITQAQETAILADMTTRLTNLVNAKPGSSAAASTNGLRAGLLRFAVGG